MNIRDETYSEIEEFEEFDWDEIGTLLTKVNIYEYIEKLQLYTYGEKWKFEDGDYVEFDSSKYLEQMVPFIAFYKRCSKCAIYCITKILMKKTKNRENPVQRTISGFFIGHVLNHKASPSIQVTNLVYFKNFKNLSKLLEDSAVRSYADGKSRPRHFFVMKEGMRKYLPKSKYYANQEEKRRKEAPIHGPFFISAKSYVLKLNGELFIYLKKQVKMNYKLRATNDPKCSLFDPSVLGDKSNPTFQKIGEELTKLFQREEVLQIITDCLEDMKDSEKIKEPRNNQNRKRKKQEREVEKKNKKGKDRYNSDSDEESDYKYEDDSGEGESSDDEYSNDNRLDFKKQKYNEEKEEDEEELLKWLDDQCRPKQKEDEVRTNERYFMELFGPAYSLIKDDA